MLGSTLAFAGMVLTIRFASHGIPVLQIAFFRNAFGMLALLPVLLWPAWRSGNLRAGLQRTVRTTQLPRYALRCAIGLVSMFCGFWALANLPLAQAVALSYSSPVFVTIGAVLLLGETVRLRRWLAVLAGFLGVLVIVRPWSHSFSAGVLVAVAAAMLGALVAIQIKQLSQVDAADTIVFWTYAFWLPLSLLPALAVWVWPQPATWLLLIACGVLGTAGQLLWTRALKIGDVSALTPISFVQLPVVALAGWWLFDETVDRWTLIGAAIILAANAYIAHREARLARRRATHALSEAVEPGN